MAEKSHKKQNKTADTAPVATPLDQETVAAAQQVVSEVETNNKSYPTLKKYNKSEFQIEGTVLKKYLGAGGDVLIPQGVTEIGQEAFANCQGLKSVTIPASVVEMGMCAFYKRTTWIDIYYKGSIAQWCDINFGLFSNPLRYALNFYIENKLVTDLVIPDTVTEIKSYAFEGFRGLKSLYTGKGVAKINYSAFSNCDNLQTIMIGPNVAEIANYAFHYDGKSSRVFTVDKSNQAIKFVGNCLIDIKTKTLVLGFANSVIPNDGSVKSIGEHAFAHCRDLTNVIIPNSVQIIRAGAFRNCTALTQITIPAKVWQINSWAFECCPNLKYVRFKRPFRWKLQYLSQKAPAWVLWNPKRAAQYLVNKYNNDTLLRGVRD